VELDRLSEIVKLGKKEKEKVVDEGAIQRDIRVGDDYQVQLDSILMFFFDYWLISWLF